MLVTAYLYPTDCANSDSDEFLVNTKQQSPNINHANTRNYRTVEPFELQVRAVAEIFQHRTM